MFHNLNIPSLLQLIILFYYFISFADVTSSECNNFIELIPFIKFQNLK